jgi:hypothetical protein
MTTILRGNTYPVRESLKALGAVWSVRERGWEVPLEKEAEARGLVRSAPFHRPISTRIQRLDSRDESVRLIIKRYEQP